jgi:hypothetical protein
MHLFQLPTYLLSTMCLALSLIGRCFCVCTVSFGCALRVRITAYGFICMHLQKRGITIEADLAESLAFNATHIVATCLQLTVRGACGARDYYSAHYD